MVETIMAAQRREGIMTTREQAEAAYDAVQGERNEETDDLDGNGDAGDSSAGR